MKLAIYDFDGTYVPIQTLPFLYKLWKTMKINDRAYNKYWRKIMRTYVLHKLHLCGWTRARFRSNAMAISADLYGTVDSKTLHGFFQAFHDQVQPYISQTMKDRVLNDKQAGYHTVLLSGTYKTVLEPFLQDGFDSVIGTPLYQDGKLLSYKEVDIIIHDMKRSVIESTFPTADFQNSIAYADSHYDLPILEVVGHPVCVNPEEDLKQVALERNYQIIYINK